MKFRRTMNIHIHNGEQSRQESMVSNNLLGRHEGQVILARINNICFFVFRVELDVKRVFSLEAIKKP